MQDPLDKTALGRTSLQVRRLAMGTAPLASIFWGNDADTAVGTAARALERGVGFFDTAPFYGLGEAERRLGRALAAAPEFPRPVIATKAGRLLTREPDGSIDVHFDFGYDAARRSLDSSLERLGVDRVDILHIHDPDDHIDEALEGTYPALVELRDQGMIGAVSLGTNSVATAAVFLERADLDCMLVAGRYTLLDRSAAELIDACARRGVAFLAAGVFNSGVLARPRSGSWYDYGPASDETLARAAAIDDVCQRHGVSLRAAAVNFPLTNPNVTAVVVGMAAPAEVDENLDALSAPVPDELWRELQGMELQA
ncbi:MAG: aldo/keto reductase [Acidimicrobiaceae bacterium]|nr:aldo/keto reductase [Acidimicrobiaceae bacterium]MXY11037.1 aldo/keto reductase [Acidimicrobiaceae bacterium]MXZ64633.1 aldo/keto reductase [Acidimicrobiaceae bacterium]MYF34636.1 aldo/keto reductase [Acidimicrobiaceae bacterium]MYG79566.1 aldo/keto reductase [Acidimicrobiaceae bacterium]